MHTSIPVSSLPVGATLASAIHDERQTKLLAAGIEITEHLLVSLRKRAVHAVVVSQSDLARINAFRPQGKARTALADRSNMRLPLETDHSRELDRQAIALENQVILPSPSPFAANFVWHGAQAYNPDLANHLAEQHELGIRKLDEMVGAIGHGDAREIERVEETVSDKLHQAKADIDAFVCLGANPFGLPYPGRHSTHTAMLAMSIGATLGLDERTLLELGIGCWIHDIGMVGIDHRTLDAARVLGPSEFAEIAKHPLKTFDLIERHLSSIPAGARMVAYQMHERANGSGYPRGRTLAQTHPLARIAAVADAYSALVAPRPHRPGMLPYYAIEKLLGDVRHGLYDPKVVRGLLETVGLFPIGSYVALNNPDLVARVIRSNGANFSRPTLEVWKRGNLSASPAIVDLAEERRLDVMKPLVTLQA